jgi:hypothetical protein
MASARAAGAVPGHLAWLRKMSTVPAIAVVLVLSRTLNVCATTLFAYATLIASSPTIGFLPRALPRQRQAQRPPRPREIRGSRVMLPVVVTSPIDTRSQWHGD